MELRDFIERGIAITGTSRKLAQHLGLGDSEMSDAKGHRRGLPNHAIYKLADLIGEEARCITAASELVTEKKEERRNYWRPFVEHARAVSYVIAVISAFVTLIVTPSPAEASIGKLSTPNALYYVKSKCYRRLFTRVISAVQNTLSTFVPRFCFSS